MFNARTQLRATALNSLGGGPILAGVIAPLVNGSFGTIAHIGLWILFGGGALVAANLVLGTLRRTHKPIGWSLPALA